MNKNTWVNSLFSSIDCKNAELFVSHMMNDCKFRFGNGPLVEGKRYIYEYISGFFVSVTGLSHTVLDVWNVEGGVVCHGSVTYTRMDQTALTVPFANIFTSDDINSDQANISKYLIFADTSALFK